jgi:Fe(3+) dicitrate transport protein
MREQAGSGSLDDALTSDELFTVDVGAHYQLLTPRLRLYGHVRNLLNEHALVSRRPFGARPNAPRWLQVGAQIEF